MTEVENRVRSGDASPGGFVAPSGVETMKAALRGRASEFASWRAESVTKLVAGALRHLAVHTPRDLTSSDQVMVQCGITEGLLLAVQLLDDPSSLWPGVFSDGGKPADVPPPPMNYTTSIDSVLGQ